MNENQPPDREINDWFNLLPDRIKVVAYKFPGKVFFRIKDTNQLCVVIAYNSENDDEEVTLTVEIVRGHNYGYQIIGVNPNQLEIYHGEKN